MSSQDVIPAEFGKIYSKLGNDVAAALPQGWHKAWVQAEMDTDNGMVACYYATAAQPKPQQLDDMPLSIYKDFRALQDAARRFEPANVWTTATFILGSDRKFKVELGYEPIPIEDQYERRIEWENKYFADGA
ncbi:MAG: immunity protein YezG family protein [Vulcanimicrobiaceae bacterium]